MGKKKKDKRKILSIVLFVWKENLTWIEEKISFEKHFEL